MILLDGLDEVADTGTRTKVLTWVKKRIHIHANNRFFITSRPLAEHDNPVPGVTTLQILPLSQNQIGHFVSHWYLANGFNRL